MYLDLIREHDERDQRFQASLHGVKLADRDGRFDGIRQGHLERMKARRRGHHGA